MARDPILVTGRRTQRCPNEGPRREVTGYVFATTYHYVTSRHKLLSIDDVAMVAIAMQSETQGEHALSLSFA